MNEVLLAVTAAGLEPHEFRWGTDESPFPENDGGRVSALIHARSEFYFSFDLRNEKDHLARFSPGKESGDGLEFPGEWRGQMECVKKWLQYLRRELDAPDLWAQVLNTQQNVPVDAARGVENTPFTPAERATIATSFRELKEFIALKAGITEAQLAAVDERLAYLEGATERLGRKDWINAAIGALISMVVGAALPPDVAKDVISMAWAGLRWLVSGSPLFPGALQ